MKHKEAGGEGFNQLRFDDTTGQISAQLHSSHGATQLNLGNLSHPKEQAQSDGRGEGFELRTDAYGAVRAAKGMLITTYAQENALAEHLEASKEQALLTQGQESMAMLSDIAVKQQTDALNVINRLPKFIQSLQLSGVNQALNATIRLFEQGLSTDPFGTLSSCGGFINDIGLFGGNVTEIIENFNNQFVNAPESISNLENFMAQVGANGDLSIQAKIKEFIANLSQNPYQVLQSLGQLISNIDLSSLDFSQAHGGYGAAGSIAPINALKSLQGFMQEQTEKLENSKNPEEQAQGKIFRQALMLLASPNGIALTTPEDIFLNAVQDIAQAAQGSINLSAQKDIIGHALDKISLFAAQKGINLFAAKEKIKIQAQDDAIEAIARKVIQIISTEDKIELTSAKEISLTAGGSQLKINGNGIFSKTGGKFESKAGQHYFMNGEKVTYQTPQLPNLAMYSNKLDVYDLFWQSDFSQLKYQILMPETNSYIAGQVDEHGRTGKITTADPSQVKVLIGSDEEWGISLEGYDEDDFIDVVSDEEEHQG